jgi:hypothetical protein
MRSRWRSFCRLLAHHLDCPESRWDWGQPMIRCDLDLGHRGLHQHFDGGGYWVWHSGGWYAQYVTKLEPGEYKRGGGK